MHFEDGFHLVLKRDCPTCTLIEPEIRKLVESEDFGQNLRFLSRMIHHIFLIFPNQSRMPVLNLATDSRLKPFQP